MAKRVVLLLGGARSGKSTYGQKLAEELGQKVLFVATGEALDEEMRARIEAHQKARPPTWRMLELPRHVGKGIAVAAADADVVIVDCLTLLVSNLLGTEADPGRAGELVGQEMEQLVDAMNDLAASFIIVSNEVGLGLVPDNPLGRLYRDLLGKANQLVAERADELYLMVAGIPVKIKG